MVHKFDRRPSRKHVLFEAAAQLVAAKGFESLTIDALAKAANVTKGGVQYHFPAKDQLVTELLEHLLSSFDAALTFEVSRTAQPARWLSAYVSLSLGEATAGDGAVAAILAALPPGDVRGAPFARYARKWRALAGDSGLEPALGQIIRLAADALWVERAFGGATPEDSAAIIKKLQALIRENAR